jgi:hypothetical protein
MAQIYESTNRSEEAAQAMSQANALRSANGE